MQSVLAQQGGTWQWEHIIQDDGSTDDTATLFAKQTDPRVRYARSPRNQGVNAARNAAIKRATGEWILLLDSDDILAPNALATIERYARKKQLHALSFFATIDGATGKSMSTVESNRVYTYKEWLAQTALHGEFIACVHRSIFTKHPWPTKLLCFESYYWNAVIREHGVFATNDPLRQYSYAATNRVSRVLADPSSAAKRYADYQTYLTAYRADYERFAITSSFAAVLRAAGVFAILAEKRAEGKKLLQESMRITPSLQTHIALALASMSPWLFRQCYKLYIRGVRI